MVSSTNSSSSIKMKSQTLMMEEGELNEGDATAGSTLREDDHDEDGQVVIEASSSTSKKGISSKEVTEDPVPQTYCCGCSKCGFYSLITLLIVLVLAGVFLAIGGTVGYAKEEPYVESEGGGVTRADDGDHTNDESPYSDPAGRFTGGYPVWSNDPYSKAIAGVEILNNQGFHFIPLDGFTGSINPRYRVFVQSDVYDSNTRIDLFKEKDHPSSLYFMKKTQETGYLLVNYLRQPDEERGSIIYELSSSTGTLALPIYLPELSNSGLDMDGAPYTAIPSRDGAIIAGIAWTRNDVDSSTQPTPPLQLRVVLIDTTTAETIVMTNRLELATNTTMAPVMFWTEDSQLVILDQSLYTLAGMSGEADSVEGENEILVINATDGSVSYIDQLVNQTSLVEGCIPYFPTSSSKVRASDGMVVDVESNEIVTYKLDGWQQTCAHM